MKLINLQCPYDIPDEYKFIALNKEGVLCGFRNAPIRDYRAGQWIDPSDNNSTGEMLLYDRWDQSCREVALLTNMRLLSPVAKRAHEQGLKHKRKLKGENCE